MLIDLHLLQNHAPSNLNRDDTGSPKDAIFGGVPRARISSQCLKRSIRRSPLFTEALDGHLAARTRKLADRVRAALSRLGVDSAEAQAIAVKVSGLGSGKEDAEKQETRQTIFCADHEVEDIARRLHQAYTAQGADAFGKLKTEDIEQLVGPHHPRSADVALFGRMTTSAAFEDVSAAVQVAHALGTTRLERQFDYFTAVDDLQQVGEDAGADMIGDVEFNSATYYKFFTLSVDDLLTNLGGDREVARRTVGAFLRAATLTTPTGKQNSFAAHNPPDAILVELRATNLPLSYANAFVKPVLADDTDVVQRSVERLVCYRDKLTRLYDVQPQRALWLSLVDEPAPADAERMSSLGALLEAVLGELP